MVKEEILEGLRAALAKGEPLRRAMMSFYNAGYPKQDIEEAAKALSTPQIQPVVQPVQPTTTAQQPQTQPIQPQVIQPGQPQQIIQQIPGQPATVIQAVSAYGGKKPRSSITLFALIFFLVALLGILVALFLFKDEISNLLGGYLLALLT